MKCMVFGAGDMCREEKISKRMPEDYVIAADGGYPWAQFLGLKIDLVVGDFDSLSGDIAHDNVERFPVEKNETDMALAVLRGIKCGYETFYLYGGTGGRPDHTIANYQLLLRLSKEKRRGFLVDDRMTALVLSDGSIEIVSGNQGLLSVFCMGETAKGVTLEGVKFPLDKHTLTNNFALGVSNLMQDKVIRITVQEGSLLILGEFLPDDVTFQ